METSERGRSVSAQNNECDLTVIVPVTERPDDATTLHRQYRTALEKLGWGIEFIYVIDGHFNEFKQELLALKQQGEQLTIVQLGKHFGEAAAIEAGRSYANGDWILTLPAYHQFESEDLPKLFDACSDFDMSVGRRNPRVDSRFNRAQSKVFHKLVAWMTSTGFGDLSCGARLIRSAVLDEVPLYGDQHRFLPVLATRRGFRVREVDLAQSTAEKFRRMPKIGIYPRRLLDLITVYFLVKFTKKPLRFFGMIGATCTAFGGIWMAVLIAQRLMFDMALAQRPALMLAALLVVLGVQVFALGLIGEIIIFVHARNIREYTVEEVVN